MNSNTALDIITSNMVENVIEQYRSTETTGIYSNEKTKQYFESNEFLPLKVKDKRIITEAAKWVQEQQRKNPPYAKEQYSKAEQKVNQTDEREE